MFPVAGRRESLAGSSVTSSPSIPIAPAERSESEIQLEDDEAKAQFREHAMFQRIFYSVRDNNNNKNQQSSMTTVPSLNRTVSLPFFPVLPNTISLPNNEEAQATQGFHYENGPKVTLATNETSWRSLDMQQGQGHTMIGSEFIFISNNSGPTSSSSSYCNDEDVVFEMDDM